MHWIPMRVPQAVLIENVDFFPEFLSSSRVEEEFDEWVRTPKGFRQTWCCVVNIAFLFLTWNCAWIDSVNRQQRAFVNIFWQWPRTHTDTASFNMSFNCTLQHYGLTIQDRWVAPIGFSVQNRTQSAPKVKLLISFEKKSVFTNRTAEIPRNAQKILCRDLQTMSIDELFRKGLAVVASFAEAIRYTQTKN